jgi:hypothetical protein
VYDDAYPRGPGVAAGSPVGIENYRLHY